MAEAGPATPRPALRFRDAQIEMAHGAGGKASRRLVEGLLAPLLGGPLLDSLEDAATVELAGVDLGGRRLVITTDSFVVKPLRFPGGSIGELAVNGTVNDLAVSGARPLGLVASLILEAGLRSEVLEREVRAVAAAAARAGVAVLGGDTKVVEHGKADGMYLTTTGIGLVEAGTDLAAARVRPGDRVLLSGPIGDHGVTVLLARGELELEADLVSDTRSVWPLVAALLEAAPGALRWMRDPTRGGVASALNELARDAGLGVSVREHEVPLRDAVRGACEILGLDPFHIANEGQFLAVVAPDAADRALEALRAAPGGEAACSIGEIVDAHPRTLVAETRYGARRVVDMLVGDPLPRIC